MTRRKATVILAVGTAATVAAASQLRGPRWPALELVGKAAGAAIVAGVVGALILALLRQHSLGTQTMVVTLTPITGVAAGAVAAGHEMFVAQRPYAALAVVLFSSGTLGLLVGLLLAHGIGSGTESLAVAARRIGRGESAAPVPEPPTEELARVARELELMSARLSASRTRERALETSRRELVAWVSHDLRTPLARIRAVVEALEDEVVEDSADYHHRLRLETDRLAVLIDGLFELSRISAGTLALELEPLRLGESVSNLVAAFTPLAEASSVQLSAELRGPNPLVNASMEHLERALSNLLENAIRYSRPGSSVEVEVGTGDAGAYVTIADSCGGIPADQLERLFDIGYARQRIRRSNSGTGLGLAIAKGLIDAHGGTVTVTDAPRGCRFVVSLPLAGAGANRAAGAISP